MRRFFLETSLMAIVAMLCVACSDKFDEPKVNGGNIGGDGVLSVSMDGDMSRTYIEEDGSVCWHADDRVAVFYGDNTLRQYRFDGNTGDDSGKISPVGDFKMGKELTASAIYALYPYSDNVSLDNGKFAVTMPSEQSYAEDTFARGANVMVAVTKDMSSTDLSFRNVTGAVKLQLWGDFVVERITLKGNNGEVLAGDAMITASYSNKPAITLADDGSKSVTLLCDGVKLNNASSSPKSFWIALPPVTFTKGFTIEVEDAKGRVVTKKTEKEIVIRSSSVQPMAAFEVVAVSKPANNEIWYTTSDGNAVTLRAQCFDAAVASHEKRGDNWVISFTGTLTIIGIDGSSTGAFENSSNLESITIPDSVTKMHAYTFYDCGNLKSVELSNNLQLIGGMSFYNCTSLTEITLPASVKNIDGAAFYDCSNLTTVNSLATTPPTLGGDDVFAGCNENVKIYVPDSAIGAYLQNSMWKKYTITTLSGNVPDDALMYAPNDPDYTSSDYSANGTYKALQTATAGNGIDIVLMGDGYSDRQVASGRYEADMRKAMEIFFSKEPYTSFRHLFNVYMVTCVSKREGYSDIYTYPKDETALNCYIKSDGVSVDADTWEVYGYAKDIFGEQQYEYNDGPRIDESTLIVIMNSDVYAGVCQMSNPKCNTDKDYGNGASLSFFPLCGDDTLFANLLIHEACGHGFAKLADEYFSSGNGAINEKGFYEIKDFEQWGWYKNVDATIGEPLTAQTIKWKHFLNDARYDGLVGIYEGAYTFAKNAYRPSEESIMRHVRGSDGEFNAPSREAIYYRIHKLAYGDSWVYNFEDFVTYDAINR